MVKFWIVPPTYSNQNLQGSRMYWVYKQESLIEGSKSVGAFKTFQEAEEFIKNGK